MREDADGNDADGELESGSSISNSSLTHSYPSKNWSQSSGVTEGFNAGTDTGTLSLVFTVTHSRRAQYRKQLSLSCHFRGWLDISQLPLS